MSYVSIKTELKYGRYTGVLLLFTFYTFILIFISILYQLEVLYKPKKEKKAN